MSDLNTTGIKPVTMFDSPEAARPATVSGWLSSNGAFFHGDAAERLARFAGCTHKRCECGEVMTKSYTKCERCRNKAKRAAYDALPKHPWPDHGFVYDEYAEEWFDGADDLIDHYDDMGISLDRAMLYAGEPQMLSEIQIDLWYDQLPEDGDYPDELVAIVEEANAKIRAITQPVSYVRSERAVSMDTQEKEKE